MYTNDLKKLQNFINAWKKKIENKKEVQNRGQCTYKRFDVTNFKAIT